MASVKAAEKSALQTQVEEVIALRPVVIISKSTCPFSNDAKEAVKAAGCQRPAVVEIDRLGPPQQAEIQDHMEAMTGGRTVPRVFIGRSFVGGGTETAQLQESGKLAKLIEDAEAQHMSELRGVLDSASVTKSEEDWKSELGSAYNVLRQRGTEAPGSSKYDQFLPEAGHFVCGACGLPLYSASSKFKSSCGWPVFDKCYYSEEVGCHVGTRSDGSGSLEIFCPRCNSHLGHVFFDAHTEKNPNGERH